MRTHDFQIRTHPDGRDDRVTITTTSGITLHENNPRMLGKIEIGTGPIITGRPMMAAAKWIASRYDDCLDDQIVLWRGKTKCLENSVRAILYGKRNNEDAGSE